MTRNEAITVSAIIPTRDRPDLLADSLRSLMIQTNTDFEVIVVDDGSECDLESVVRRIRGPVSIRYVRQEPAGLNVGRNTGAAEARGSLLAYLDDDTIVATGWADGMHRAAATGVAAVAGRIQLWFEGQEPDWLTDKLRSYLSELDLGDGSIVLEKGHHPYGANCAVQREWFDRVGGFRTGLDRIGASLVSNGDTEFFRRIQASGGDVVYWPDATVLHRVPETRLTREFFIRRAYAQGVSDVLLEDAAPALTLRSRAREQRVRARVIPVFAKAAVRGSGAQNAACWLAYSRGRIAALKGDR